MKETINYDIAIVKVPISIILVKAVIPNFIARSFILILQFSNI